MNQTRWLVVIAAVGLLGCLQVAMRNGVILKSYALGERVEHARSQDTVVSHLGVQISELISPVHLSQIAKERRLKLVAWSKLKPRGISPLIARSQGSDDITDKSVEAKGVIRVAAIEPSENTERLMAMRTDSND